MLTEAGATELFSSSQPVSSAHGGGCAALIVRLPTLSCLSQQSSY